MLLGILQSGQQMTILLLFSRTASMLSDSPHSYKLASNLIRSIPTPNLDDEDSRNSMNSHLEKRRNHRRLDINRTNRRRHRNGERRGNGSKQAHKCLTESNSCDDDDLALSDEEFFRNGDLVRSLDRRSSHNKDKKKRKKKRRKNRKNKQRRKSLGGEEEAERRKRDRKRKRKSGGDDTKEARRARKAERRKRRQERKKRQREARRRERRRQRKLAKAAEEAAKQSEEGAKHHLSVRSADEQRSPSSGQCVTHLVDTCSWPHCNPTCPKLKHPKTGKNPLLKSFLSTTCVCKPKPILCLSPLTPPLFSLPGQEIDFITLLKSFGLDMSSVARAMGMDVATLNGMDRDRLAHLLTSHGKN